MAKRNNSIDMLRCISMLFVVIIHIMGHSGFLKNLTEHNTVFFLSNFLASCVRVAVPVFVLITGYFGINFKTKKLIGMEISLLFYGVFSMLLAWLITGNIETDFMNIAKTFLPFSYRSWWFSTMYMVLLIFSPFINKLLDNINQKQHLTLLLASFVLFNVVSSFSLDPIDTTGGYGFVNFIFLYCIGRYIRKYGLFGKINKWLWLLSYLGCSSLIFISYLLYGSYKFGTYNSVLLLLSSVSLFMFFERQSINANVFSKTAPYTFAVYLITDNLFMRQVVNKLLFDPCKYQEHIWVVGLIIIYAILLMVVCMLADFVIKKISGRAKAKLVDFIDEKVNALFTFLCKLLLKN